MPTPYLPKGQKTYKITARVPERYREVVGTTHVSRSLGTRDPKEAKRRVHAVMNELYVGWEAKHQSASPHVLRANAPSAPSHLLSADGNFYFENVEHACAAFREDMRERHQAARVLVRKDALTNPEKFWRGEIVPVPTDARDCELKTAVVKALREMVRRERDALMDQMAVLDLEPLHSLVSLFLKPPHCDDQDVIIALGRAYKQLLEAVLADDLAIFDFVDENNGQWGVQPAHGVLPSVSAIAATLPRRNTSPSLSRFLDGYIDERGNGLSEERADVLRAVVRDFIDVCGDKPVGDYKRDDASRFKSVVLRLPANLSKRGDFQGLSLEQAANKAKSLGLGRQSAKNITKKWAALGSLFRHAALNHDGVENYFVARALVVSDNVPAAEQKTPFTAGGLRVLMASELSGPLHWLTRLALYTGARANELCQLTADLVRETDNVHYIYFSPELRLKTKRSNSSVRAVPIHADLIEQGFLQFVKKANGGDLFPNLTVHRSGRRSDATGKMFTRHLKLLGIKQPRVSFHSLRHNFSQAWDRAQPQAAETRERLMGHVVPGVAGRYGAGYEGEALDMVLLRSRAELLNTVQFLPRVER